MRQQPGTAAPPAVAALVAAVQANCHIADAGQAGELPLCSYLLQMREYHRWEQRMPYHQEPPRAALSRWLSEREALWDTVAGRAPGPLPVPLQGGPRDYPADDVDGINRALAPLGLIYGAGWIAPGRPSYFLARRHAPARQPRGAMLHDCAEELARGLFAPPAMLCGDGAIVLRRESFARALWERFEAHSLRRAEGPMRALLDHFGAAERMDFCARLPQLVDALAEVLVLHESGEHQAGQRLGPHWGAMRLELDDRLADLYLRAVRDQLADLEVTLPAIAEAGRADWLHFWFAGYEGPRQQLFPALGQAYAAWLAGDGGRALRRACAHALPHFQALAEGALALHARHGSAAGGHIARQLRAGESVCAWRA